MAFPLNDRNGSGSLDSPDDERGVDIKLRIFIPSPAIEMPVPVPLMDNRYFGGDDRGFGYSGGTARAEIHCRVIPRATGAQPFENGEFFKYVETPHWGESKEWAPADVHHDEERPGWWWNVRSGAEPIAAASHARTEDNLHAELGGGSAGDGFASAVMGTDHTDVTLHAAGNLPLVTISPNINCDLVVSVVHFDGELSAKVEGSHDGFPAYELYVDGHLLYSHHPETADQTPLSLLPPSEFSVTVPWTKIPSALSAAQASRGRHPSGRALRYGRTAALVSPIIESRSPWGAIGEILDFLRRHQSFVAGVPETTFFPFSAICQLKPTFPSATGTGTGFYIAPDLVLTAAHNVDNRRHGLARSMEIRAGRNGATWLNHFTASPDDWTVHDVYADTATRYDRGHDLAVIRVNTPPPNNFHFDLINYSPSPETSVAVCGYASGRGRADEDKQNIDIDRVRRLSAGGEIVEYNLQTLTGTSGAPVFVDFENTTSGDHPPDGLPVMGVHVAKGDDQHNRAVLLTPDKIDWARGGGIMSVAQGFSVRRNGGRNFAGLPVVRRPGGVVGGLPVSAFATATPGLMSGRSSVGGLPVRPQGARLLPARTAGGDAAIGAATLVYSIVSGAAQQGVEVTWQFPSQLTAFHPKHDIFSDEEKKTFLSAPFGDPVEIPISGSVSIADTGINEAYLKTKLRYWGNGYYIRGLSIRVPQDYDDAALTSIRAFAEVQGDPNAYGRGDNRLISRVLVSVYIFFDLSFGPLERTIWCRHDIRAYANGHWQRRVNWSDDDIGDVLRRVQEDVEARKREPKMVTQSLSTQAEIDFGDQQVTVSPAPDDEWWSPPELVALAPEPSNGNGVPAMIASARRPALAIG